MQTVSSHNAVGWSAVCNNGHTHLLLGLIWSFRNCDVKLTKVASTMRRDFDSVLPDYKEAST